MRGIVCERLGDPSVLTAHELPEPDPPGPGMVEVAQAAWGLTFVDLLMVAGDYQLKPALPFIPGSEAAGIVRAVGPGVATLAPGNRVMTSHRPGALAERVTIPADKAMPIPDAMDLAAAACFRSAFATAYHALVQGARLTAGETVLVHGATGGVGHAAVQVGKRLGATVIATAGGPDKADAARSLGADHVIDHHRGAFRDPVKDLTGGRGVDVVFDPVGGSVFEQSMRCLNWGARLLIIGFAGGERAMARTNHLLIKGASAVGIRAGEFGRRHPEIAAENMRVLLEWAAAGKIAPRISHRLPFDRAAEGLRLIANREVIGRAVLTTEPRPPPTP